MSTFLQIFTILSMIFLTYVMYHAFGTPRKTLLYTKEEKIHWDALMAKPLGSWFTVTNIVGTLSSLAGCYVFFIGNAHVFGWAIFACSITILFSAKLTNAFTKKLLDQEYYKAILESHEQTAGVIASVFWRPADRGAQATAAAAKFVSLITIASVIWLEFAFFGHVAGQLLHFGGLLTKMILIALCCFTITYFTLRYGVRGIVFADAFQSPLIAFAGVLLIVGCVLAFTGQPIQLGTFKPILIGREVALFILQLTFLNLFINLVTESHWIRLWIFKTKEIKMQQSAMTWTAALWAILAIVGIFAGQLSGATPGMATVTAFLTKLDSQSVIFTVAFWIGAMAALFSTADAQIYSFLVVRQFDRKNGVLSNLTMATLSPPIIALVVAIAFASAYGVVDYYHIGLDQLVFVISPICLNIVPAFVRVYYGKQQRAAYVWVSVILYTVFSIISLLNPAAFYLRLLPPLVPMAVALVARFK